MLVELEYRFHLDSHTLNTFSWSAAKVWFRHRQAAADFIITFFSSLLRLGRRRIFNSLVLRLFPSSFRHFMIYHSYAILSCPASHFVTLHKIVSFIATSISGHLSIIGVRSGMFHSIYAMTPGRR